MAMLEATDFTGEVSTTDCLVSSLYTDLGSISLALKLTKEAEEDRARITKISNHLDLAIEHIQTGLFAGGVIPISLTANVLETVETIDNEVEATIINLPVATQVPEENIKSIVTTKQKPKISYSKKFNYEERESKIAAERIDQVEPNSLAIFDYVLKGGDIPTSLIRKNIIMALQKISGSEELKNPEVADRFDQLNEILTGAKKEEIKIANTGFHFVAGMITGGLNDPRALCLGADNRKFFTERGASQKPAKKVCASCPIVNQCLDYSLDNREVFGVWGGKSERERRKLRKARNQAKKLEAQSQKE